MPDWEKEMRKKEEKDRHAKIGEIVENVLGFEILNFEKFTAYLEALKPLAVYGSNLKRNYNNMKYDVEQKKEKIAKHERIQKMIDDQAKELEENMRKEGCSEKEIHQEILQHYLDYEDYEERMEEKEEIEHEYRSEREDSWTGIEWEEW